MITLKQFAAKIGMSHTALQQAFHRRPDFYPKAYKLSPGQTATLRFYEQDVAAWIDEKQHK